MRTTSTALDAVIEESLDTTIAEWVLDQRTNKKISWDRMSRQLLKDHDIDVTGQTLRNRYAQYERIAA